MTTNRDPDYIWHSPTVPTIDAHVERWLLDVAWVRDLIADYRAQRLRAEELEQENRELRKALESQQ